MWSLLPAALLNSQFIIYTEPSSSNLHFSPLTCYLVMNHVSSSEPVTETLYKTNWGQFGRMSGDAGILLDDDNLVESCVSNNCVCWHLCHGMKHQATTKYFLQTYFLSASPGKASLSYMLLKGVLHFHCLMLVDVWKSGSHFRKIWKFSILKPSDC